MTDTVTVIPAKGTVQILSQRESIPLEVAQKLVGDGKEVTVEVLDLSDGRQMLLDEEGKMKGLPINQEATKLTRGLVADDDLIVGTVIILDGKARWLE